MWWREMIDKSRIQLWLQENWAILALALVGFILRIIQLGKENIWVDEGLSILFAMQPVDMSIQSMLEEGLHHSPLYYLLLRPFLAGGFSEFNARLLSAILGALRIPAIAKFGKELFSMRAMTLARAEVAGSIKLTSAAPSRRYIPICRIN